METGNIKRHSFGLDLEKHLADADRPTNYLLGAVEKEVLEPAGQWTEFMPECEIQKSDYADFMDCVTESAINAISILLQRKFNILIDRSQRFTAKMSGTTRSGNSLFAVSDSLRHDGTAEETDWKRDRSMTWNEYYMDIPAFVRKRGLKILDQFEISYEKVPVSKAGLKEALKYGPVQVIGYAWASDGMLYHDYGYSPNHAFLLVGYVEGQYWIVYDSYPTDFIIDENSDKQEYIKHLSWDYKFGDALLYSIKLKPETTNWLYKIMQYLKGLLWFHPDMGGDGSMWMTKTTKDKGSMRKKCETVGDILSILDQNFGVEKTDWGKLSHFKEVDKF